MKPASLIGSIIFALVALSHLLRVVFQLEVLIGGAVIPMWVSVVAVIVTAALTVALWREAQPGPGNRPHSPASIS